MHPRSRDSVVNIVTRLRAAGFGLRIAAGQKDIFLFSNRPYRRFAHPASSSLSTGMCPPGVMWPGFEADHSLPLGAEVKN